LAKVLQDKTLILEIMPRQLLFQFLFLFYCLPILTLGTPPKDKPNILLIMADDVGIEGFGCYGGTSYKTPQIDALSASGLRFTHAYSQPLCTPTRVQIMTGKYNHRNWTYFGILDPTELTFGHLMQQAGYKTCIAGKWQLQSYDPPDFPNAQHRRGKGMKVTDAGFNEHCLFHSWHTEDKGSRYANPTFFRNGELVKSQKGMYGPDISIDFILDFLRRHKNESTFVYYPMALPHWPMVPTPDSKEWCDPERRLEEDVRFFGDMMVYMDKLVGRLLSGLEKLGLRENTLILFYSDNGTHLKVNSQMGKITIPGGKATPRQTGIRVPLIANWPSVIQPGQTSSQLVDASDFLPTFAELANYRLNKSEVLDGLSFAPRLLGKNGTVREWCFFWYDPRPGWDKERFNRSIFTIDHQYKLYSDGRLFEIDHLLPLETELNLKTLSPKAVKARQKLQAAIDQCMKPPLSENARRIVNAFGEPTHK